MCSINNRMCAYRWRSNGLNCYGCAYEKDKPKSLDEILGVN